MPKVEWDMYKYWSFEVTITIEDGGAEFYPSVYGYEVRTLFPPHVLMAYDDGYVRRGQDGAQGAAESAIEAYLADMKRNDPEKFLDWWITRMDRPGQAAEEG